MKKTTFTILLAFSCCWLVAQCPTGDITFSTQGQIDSFQINYPGCMQILGDVRIEESVFGSIINLDSFSQINSIGGDLYVFSNLTLTSLSGLDNLDSIGGILYVANNAALTSLSGLDNIDPATITGMTIINNPQLFLCGVQSVCDYLENGHYIFAANNASSCNSEVEIAAACQAEAQCPVHITFFTQSQVDGFQINHPNCTEIEGSVIISGSSITNLDSLYPLKKIGGNLQIGQTALTDLNGLNSLDSVKGFLQIVGNPSLVALSGLENLKYVGYGGIPIMFGTLVFGIHITGNQVLTSLHSLKNVKSARCLTISGNPSLTSLSGLDSLSYVGFCQDKYDSPNTKHGLRIWENATLSTLSGLNSLDTSLYEVSIYGNGLLTSLSGLENLDFVGKWYVSNNYSLSPCSVLPLCTHLENGGPVFISNNAPGCNSVAEIEAACLVPVGETGPTWPPLQISPNPAGDLLHIQIDDKEKWEISLFDLQGTLLYRQTVCGNHRVLLSDWPAGLYTLRATAGERVYAGRFVKQ